MSDSKISALPAAAALSGPEELAGVQSAANVKVTATQLKTFAKAGLASTDVGGLGTLATQSGTFSGTSSGTNTGDQTSIVGITGTKAQFDTAVSDDNPAYLGTNQSFTKAQGVNRVALTDAATVAVDASLSNAFTLTLAGNRTLGQPTNPKDGQSLTIKITQDGTGTRTLAYHADWLFPGGTDPVLSTAISAVDVLSAVYFADTAKWYAVLNKALA